MKEFAVVLFDGTKFRVECAPPRFQMLQSWDHFPLQLTCFADEVLDIEGFQFLKNRGGKRFGPSAFTRGREAKSWPLKSINEALSLLKNLIKEKREGVFSEGAGI